MEETAQLRNAYTYLESGKRKLMTGNSSIVKIIDQQSLVKYYPPKKCSIKLIMQSTPFSSAVYNKFLCPFYTILCHIKIDDSKKLLKLLK